MTERHLAILALFKQEDRMLSSNVAFGIYLAFRLVFIVRLLFQPRKINNKHCF